MFSVSSVPGFWRFFLKGPVRFVFTFGVLVASPLFIMRLTGEKDSSNLLEAGIALGTIAFMLVLSLFWLSGRFEFINGHRGIDLTLRFHKRLATLIIILTIGHVILVSSKSIPDNFLVIALIFLLIVIQIVLAKLKTKFKIKYEDWRGLHGFFGIAIAAGIAFHAINEGGYSSHPAMVGFWAFATIASVLSLLYAHVLVPYRNSKRPYEIVEKVKVADKQWKFTVKPKGFEPMAFYSGQYAFVSFGRTPFTNSAHPFSFCSSPSELPNISFTIKELGDFTHSIGDIPMDENVYLTGPYGHLCLENRRGPDSDEKGIVLIAGGIGITPIFSILKDLHARNYKHPIRVYYACKEDTEIAFYDEIKEIQTELDLNVQFFASVPSLKTDVRQGRLDKDYIAKEFTFNDYQGHLYFLCGTTGFIDAVVAGLESVGDIPMFNVVFEDFSVYS